MQGQSCDLTGKDDNRDFKRLTSSMEVLGIQVEQSSLTILDIFGMRGLKDRYTIQRSFQSTYIVVSRFISQ